MSVLREEDDVGGEGCQRTKKKEKKEKQTNKETKQNKKETNIEESRG